MKNIFFTPKIPIFVKKLAEKSNYQHSLAKLISEKKWRKVLGILTSEGGKYNEYSNYQYKCNSECEQGHSLLHLALRFHPPPLIVQAMIEVFPDGPFKTDCRKRYPLHIAAKYGTDVENIKMLLHANPNAAEAVDLNGQTPLHLVFHDYRWKTDTRVEFGREFKQMTFEVCKLLCDVAPQSVLIEVDGVSVIEKALIEDVDIKVLKALQRKTKKLREEKSKEVNISAPSVQNEVHQVMFHRRSSITSPVLRQYNNRAA